MVLTSHPGNASREVKVPCPLWLDYNRWESYPGTCTLFMWIGYIQV